MKRVKLLLICLLVTLPALACVPPTPTNTPTLTNTPTPTPMPSIIRVEVDGSGDYATLEEAVENAPEGVPIALGTGTFHLEEPLDISRPITLQGEGMDQTEIVSETEWYVVRFAGGGLFVVEDITFRHEGRAAADAVLVQGGEVAFTRCRFTGAVSDEDESIGVGGVGLRLERNTVGVVQACEAEENGAGILVADFIELTLEGNTVKDNEEYGLIYGDNAGGVARGNECSGNRVGIFVARAQPTLEKNVCNGNELAGIYYTNEAGGVARENDCSGNAVGIVVDWASQPLLEENICTDNAYHGILYEDHSGGAASHNECSENGAAGIAVSDQADPTLEENVCEDNGVVGIYYIDESGGVARGNECSGNLYGIYVVVTANPELIDNDCHDNSDADILDERS